MKKLNSMTIAELRAEADRLKEQRRKVLDLLDKKLAVTESPGDNKEMEVD